MSCVWGNWEGGRGWENPRGHWERSFSFCWCVETDVVPWGQDGARLWILLISTSVWGKTLTIKPHIVLYSLECTSCSSISQLPSYQKCDFRGINQTASASEVVSLFILQPCTFLDWTGTCSPCRDRCTSCQRTIQVAYLFLPTWACRRSETQAWKYQKEKEKMTVRTFFFC